MLLEKTSLNDSPVRLLFGVDSKSRADVLLQNNIDLFEWIVRNKVYPSFFVRNLNGENCLTTEEIAFLHHKGCRIAVSCVDQGEKNTDEEGELYAQEVVSKAIELNIPKETAIYLELGEQDHFNHMYMRGFAKYLLNEGYTPGFKANTDAKFGFDREYSRGMRTDRDIFGKCLVWALAPTLEDYDGITSTHLIQPENWKPFAPSGITRRDIALWRYGKDCHPIEDIQENRTSFNLNLVRNEEIITKKMF